MNITDYKKLFTAYWEYLAIKTAAKNNVFDMIEREYNDLESLSNKGGFQKDVLIHLLNALELSGLVININNKYKLTDNGKLFTENHLQSLKYACIHWAEEHMTAWQNLDYTLKTGKSAFEYIYKKPLFDYLADKEERVDNYHKAMYEYARDDYNEICSKIDFSESNSIIDIGGSYGALVKNIIKKCPNKRIYLFDKPEVIEKLNIDNIKLLEGDFFDKIPTVADTAIMSRIIHDWNNTKALTILKNTHQALPKNGYLYLIENLTNRINDRAALLSLNMYLITKSYERTEKEYTVLLQQAGFKVLDIIKINDLQHAIKSIKL